MAKKNGKFKQYFITGELKSEGEYLEGEISGKFEQYYKDGEKYFRGQYLNGKRNGYGEEYTHDLVTFEGMFIDGKK